MELKDFSVEETKAIDLDGNSFIIERRVCLLPNGYKVSFVNKQGEKHFSCGISRCRLGGLNEDEMTKILNLINAL